MRRTVLNQLPESGGWKKFDEPEMIERPDLNNYICCRILENVEVDNHTGHDLRTGHTDEDMNLGGNIQELKAGTVYFVRYAVVKDFVEEGKIELLI